MVATANGSTTNPKHAGSMASSYKESLMQNSTIIPSESDEIIEEEEIIIEEGEESCPLTRQPFFAEENAMSPVTNQQQAEDCSFGPWMMVERKQRKPATKQVNHSKGLANMIFQGSRFNMLSEPKNGVNHTHDILTAPLTDVPIQQSKHSAIVVDENLDPNILVLPGSTPTTGTEPPAGEPPDKQMLPTTGVEPHAPVGTSLQSNQTDETSGCGNWRFLPAARQVLRDYKPDLVVFVEPRISGRKADSVIASLGFPNSHRVEAIVYATAVYASPSSSGRKLLWSHLRRLAASIRSPWVIFGDFNVTVNIDDRKGCLQTPCKAFQHLLFDYGLRDIGYQGPEFTWSRGLAQTRLDRFICNSYWYKVYPTSVVYTFSGSVLIIGRSFSKLGILELNP
ncbi:hypothetical protein V6N13_114131 [Hibiscus sabdariffa]